MASFADSHESGYFLATHFDEEEASFIGSDMLSTLLLSCLMFPFGRSYSYVHVSSIAKSERDSEG